MPDFAERARDFAKTYVHFVEALQREGVAEQVARDEAHLAALYLLDAPEPETPTVPCPLCGR